jgi:hypothetical protein
MRKARVDWLLLCLMHTWELNPQTLLLQLLQPAAEPGKHDAIPVAAYALDTLCCLHAVLLFACRALGAMEAAIALGGQWMTEAETTVPAVQQYHAGLHTLEGASCFTPGQLPLFAHSACGKPAAALGQLWWPQDTACDCCGRRMEPAELIVCPECNVAWYCCKDHEVQARRKGLHSYPACRMLNQWRMGNFAYTEWA